MMARFWQWLFDKIARADVEALYDLVGALRAEIERLRTQIDESSRP